MKSNFIEFLKRGDSKELKEMTNQEIYYKLLEYVKEEAEKKSEKPSTSTLFDSNLLFLETQTSAFPSPL